MFICELISPHFISCEQIVFFRRNWSFKTSKLTKPACCTSTLNNRMYFSLYTVRPLFKWWKLRSIAIFISIGVPYTFIWPVSMKCRFLAKNQPTLLFRSVMFVESCPMRRCSRLRCQRLFILFGCVHHYQMYVPITFVGLPLDFRKKGPEVGWKKSVGWMVAFEKHTRETPTVCCRKGVLFHSFHLRS